MTALALGEEGGGGLQGSDVRSMAQLRLGVAANHLPVAAQRQPLGLLLVVAEAFDVGQEHDPMQRDGQIVGRRGHESGKVLRQSDLAVGTRFGSDAMRAAQLDEADELGQRPDVPVLAVEVGVVVVGEDAGGVSGDESLQLPSSGRLVLAPIEEGGDDFRIERRVGALAGKVGVHNALPPMGLIAIQMIKNER